jgi:hypothetical protein
MTMPCDRGGSTHCHLWIDGQRHDRWKARVQQQLQLVEGDIQIAGQTRDIPIALSQLCDGDSVHGGSLAPVDCAAAGNAPVSSGVYPDMEGSRPQRKLPILSILLLGLASCGDGPGPGLPSDIEWRSEHFVYHARAGDDDVCPAVLDKMERHFDIMVATTGLSWPEGRVIHYYKFLDAHDYEAAASCPADTSGCARDGNAYSYQAFHQHELVHTYFAPLGHPPRILSEGVAEVLACGPFEFMSVAALRRELAAAELDDTAEIELIHPERDTPYVLGSNLVGNLIATYGWEAFLDLYRGPWHSGDEAELEQNFQDLYGVSFESAWATAKNVASHASCVPAWACAADPLVPGVAESFTDSCDDDPYRRVSSAESGVLQLETAEGGAILLECPADPGEPTFNASGLILGPSTFADLGAGSYVAVSLGGVTMTTRPIDDSMFGTECPELDAVELDPSDPVPHWDYWVFQPPTSPYFLRLDLSRDALLNVVLDGAGPILVCPSCEVSDECVSPENAAPLSVSSEVVLHFPAGSSQSPLAQLSVAVR